MIDALTIQKTLFTPSQSMYTLLSETVSALSKKRADLSRLDMYSIDVSRKVTESLIDLKQTITTVIDQCNVNNFSLRTRMILTQAQDFINE